jgi:type I restriction enzyme R subunit
LWTGLVCLWRRRCAAATWIVPADGASGRGGEGRQDEEARGRLQAPRPRRNGVALPFRRSMLAGLHLYLIPKLPAPVEEDLSRGILETIDMDSYRVEKQTTIHIALADQDGEIEPVPTTGGSYKPEPELDLLSNIVKTFNDQWGNIPWTDTDRVHRLIAEDIPARVAADGAYKNAKKNNDKQNARIEHDKALARVMTAVLKDDTELFKQFSDNESFRKWLSDSVFAVNYTESGKRSA